MTDPTKYTYLIQLKQRIWSLYFAVTMMLTVVPKIIVNIESSHFAQLSEISRQNQSHPGECWKPVWESVRSVVFMAFGAYALGLCLCTSCVFTAAAEASYSRLVILSLCHLIALVKYIYLDHKCSFAIHLQSICHRRNFATSLFPLFCILLYTVLLILFAKLLVTFHPWHALQKSCKFTFFVQLNTFHMHAGHLYSKRWLSIHSLACSFWQWLHSEYVGWHSDTSRDCIFIHSGSW
jgi:hypothetical protein